jgi:uncharacterized protein YndB with AHSA1/START domain
MHQLPTPKNRLLVEGHFSGFSPQELFDHWVTPSLLVQWWPQEAHVQAGVGGNYRFFWPDMGWELTGEYKEWVPGERLVFTWRWNFDPEGSEPKTVEVGFAVSPEGGSIMTIEHWPYDDGEESQNDRQGHLEGWIHFGMRLGGLRESTA